MTSKYEYERIRGLAASVASFNKVSNNIRCRNNEQCHHKHVKGGNQPSLAIQGVFRASRTAHLTVVTKCASSLIMPVGVVKPSNRFKLLNPSSNEPGRHNTDRCHWGAVPYIATGWGLDGGAVVGMDFTRLLLYEYVNCAFGTMVT